MVEDIIQIIALLPIAVVSIVLCGVVVYAIVREIHNARTEAREEKQRKADKQVVEAVEKTKTLVVTIDGKHKKGERRFYDLQDFSKYILKQFSDHKILPECEIIRYDATSRELAFYDDKCWNTIVAIEDVRGFLYSNGEKTSELKHTSKEIISWVEDLRSYWEILVAENKKIYLVP